MKIKNVLGFFVLFILFMLLSSNVLATEGEETKADFSNASFKAVYTNNNVQFYSLEVLNITLPIKSNGKSVEMNVRYTIGNTQPEFSSTYGESYSGTYDEETKKLVFPRLETALQLKGDVYFWIFQLDDTALGATKTGSLVYSAKLERPADKKYSELFGTPLIGSTLTYISINTPMENNLTRKAQFKIGEITDNSILSAIKNNDATNGFDKLLTYAKTSSVIYDGVLEGKPNFAASLHDELLGKVKSDTYYFIYVEFDDEGGKYYPVEGITVGLGLAPTTQSCEIAFYGNSKFNWDNFTETELPTNPTEDTDKKDDTKQPTTEEPKETPTKTENKNEEKDKSTAKISLPQTGENNMFIGFVVILIVLSIVLYCLNKKYDSIK